MKSRVPFFLSAGVAVCLSHAAAAEPVAVGAVDKVQEQVVALQAGSSRDLAAAGPVYFRDKMRTGPGARLEAKLDDGTVLTLGEKGKLTVDEFVYRPGDSGNKLATVWGGPIDGGFGVLVLKGEVWVKTKHGSVDLKEGAGTMIFPANAPEKAAPWSADRTKRAVATISFGQ